MPGGLAVIVIAVCALFTTFTGGSGITVIAIGGLVLPMLLKDGYPEDFSLGLVTAAGQPGPALPAEPAGHPLQRGRGHARPQRPRRLALPRGPAARDPDDRRWWRPTPSACGQALGLPRQPFAGREVAAAFWAAKWELLLPVFVVGLVRERAGPRWWRPPPLAFVYAIVVECFVTRDLHVFRDAAHRPREVVGPRRIRAHPPERGHGHHELHRGRPDPRPPRRPG